ncbi:CBN-TAG-332 protein [Caenorhabditis brenneri]|uniref:CBN-TAG-332 protein n=1 Tax=Caenorhabditis brenneri TaxID=135651 RepID=G0MNM7_CAEBE|nr:CBN-TAG-332 protein [Caenorhabditis brenneri]
MIQTLSSINKSIPEPPKSSTTSTTSQVKPKSATLAASTSSKPTEKGTTKKGQSILDTLLPDTFGSSSSSQLVPGSSSVNRITSPKENGNGGAQTENGENEEARIQRLRMEAKRARQQEDENSGSMSNQMEMMSAFEFDNTY